MSWIKPDAEELESIAKKAGVKVNDILLWYKFVKNSREYIILYWFYVGLWFFILIFVYAYLYAKGGF